MAFPTATDHTTFTAAMWNAIAAYFNGSSSYTGHPMKAITFNDAVEYLSSKKNLDTTLGRVEVWYKADGTKLAEITKDGFRYSSDGTTEGLTPVSLSASETVTGAKTLSGETTLSGRVLLGRAATTASATTIALPATGGPIYPISGTTTINAVTFVASLLAILEFQSAGCVVNSTGTLRLLGEFTSHGTSSTLTLLGNAAGTTWEEQARG